jgi:hypothetical protein
LGRTVAISVIAWVQPPIREVGIKPVKRRVESENREPVPMVSIGIMQNLQSTLYGTRLVFMRISLWHGWFRRLRRK